MMRKAVKHDYEKWLDTAMREMDDDLRQHRHCDFF